MDGMVPVVPLLESSITAYSFGFYLILLVAAPPVTDTMGMAGLAAGFTV
jgi:hypothetical protein